jgi:hypothetical protein
MDQIIDTDLHHRLIYLDIELPIEKLIFPTKSIKKAERVNFDDVTDEMIEGYNASLKSHTIIAQISETLKEAIKTNQEIHKNRAQSFEFKLRAIMKLAGQQNFPTKPNNYFNTNSAMYTPPSTPGSNNSARIP